MPFIEIHYNEQTSAFQIMMIFSFVREIIWIFLLYYEDKKHKHYLVRKCYGVIDMIPRYSTLDKSQLPYQGNRRMIDLFRNYLKIWAFVYHNICCKSGFHICINESDKPRIDKERHCVHYFPRNDYIMAYYGVLRRLDQNTNLLINWFYHFALSLLHWHWCDYTNPFIP